MSRLGAVRTLAGLLAFVLLVPALAVVDYIGGLLGPAGLGGVSARSTGAMNAAYGVLAGVLVSGALIAIARAPARSAAALQQFGMCAVAIGVAAVLTGDYVGLGSAGILVAALAVLCALNPDRPRLLDFRLRRAVVGALAVVGAVPWITYALLAASDGRADRPPEDSYALAASGWHAIASVAIAIPLVSGLAAVATRGWPIPAFAASLATLGLAAVWLAHPGAAGAPGRLWGGLAVVWALALALASGRDIRKLGSWSAR